MTCRYKFSFLPQYFVDYATIAKDSLDSKLTTQPNLGLSWNNPPNTEGLPWAQLRRHVGELNNNCSDDENYKVLYVARHGMSVHNELMAEVGHDAWNNHWSYIEGDGTRTWLDAKLTPSGIATAKELGDLWINWTKDAAVPLPETIYTSPLARCLQTTKLTWSRVLAEHGKELQPTVKELLRERLTNHTCDKRNSRTWIQESYPEYVLEPGFEEHDVLWKSDRYESGDEHAARKQELLEDIFTSDNSQFIALTTHSYAISAILEVIGVPRFRVAEGAMIALLIKATRVGTRALEL